MTCGAAGKKGAGPCGYITEKLLLGIPRTADIPCPVHRCEAYMYDSSGKHSFRSTFLEGLRRFQERGVAVLIDGKVCEFGELDRIFTAETGTFYIGGCIPDEKGDLKEIHFDKVTYR